MAGHLLNQYLGLYGGPPACDSFYRVTDPGATAACAATECCNTPVVGVTGFLGGNRFVIGGTSFTVFDAGSTGTPGPSCGVNTTCYFGPCPTSSTALENFSFYVNPGSKIDITFYITSEVYTDATAHCHNVGSLFISYPNPSNLGVLSTVSGTNPAWYNYKFDLYGCSATALNSGNYISVPYADTYSMAAGATTYRADLNYIVYDPVTFKCNISNYCCTPKTGYSVSSPAATGGACNFECHYTGKFGSFWDPADLVPPRNPILAVANYTYTCDVPCGVLIFFDIRAKGYDPSGYQYLIYEDKLDVSFACNKECYTPA